MSNEIFWVIEYNLQGDAKMGVRINTQESEIKAFVEDLRDLSPDLQQVFTGPEDYLDQNEYRIFSTNDYQMEGN